MKKRTTTTIDPNGNLPSNASCSASTHFPRPTSNIDQTTGASGFGYKECIFWNSLERERNKWQGPFSEKGVVSTTQSLDGCNDEQRAI